LQGCKGLITAESGQSTSGRAAGMIYIKTMRLNGFRLIAGALDDEVQTVLVRAVTAAAAHAPFHRPTTPFGKTMSVAQTSFGPLGWTSDASGYRYVDRHPSTGRPWPTMPPLLVDLWNRYAQADRPPDSCLINAYGRGARMGLHRDEDEADLAIPVLSISLGDTAIFRIGGATRASPTVSVRLASGDVCVLAGEARRAFHGVDRVLFGSSRLIEGGGRYNLTLRRAAP
jgi:alkylated DNA repair protein (DNA oxidative demethylase)